MEKVRDQIPQRTKMQIAEEAIPSCNEYIDYSISKIKELTKTIQAGNAEDANAAFVDFVDLVDLFVQLIDRIYFVFKKNNKANAEVTENFQKLQIHLLSVMKALLLAREKGDTVMLCDLLEYELTDNLLQWKIKAIPSLKQAANPL